MVTTVIILLVGVGGFLAIKKLAAKKNAKSFPKSEYKQKTGVVLPSEPTVPVEEKPVRKPRKTKK